jgi:hypothetical protein
VGYITCCNAVSTPSQPYTALTTDDDAYRETPLTGRLSRIPERCDELPRWDEADQLTLGMCVAHHQPLPRCGFMASEAAPLLADSMGVGWGASSAHVDAATTSVVGDVVPSAFAGERYDLHVQARDQFGASVKGGGAVLKAAVMDGDTVLFDAECDDNHDGTYVASFLPEVAGTYRCVTCLVSAALPTSLATQVVAQAGRGLLRSSPTPPHALTLPSAARSGPQQCHPVP